MVLVTAAVIVKTKIEFKQAFLSKIFRVLIPIGIEWNPLSKLFFRSVTMCLPVKVNKYLWTAIKCSNLLQVLNFGNIRYLNLVFKKVHKITFKNDIIHSNKYLKIYLCRYTHIFASILIFGLKQVKAQYLNLMLNIYHHCYLSYGLNHRKSHFSNWWTLYQIYQISNAALATVHAQRIDNVDY